MNIRFKTGLIIFALSFAFAVGIFIFSRTYLLENIDYEEKRLIYEEIERSLQIVDRDTQSLAASCLDWSGWDDTYYFIKGEYPTYVEDNLINDTFRTLNINMIAVIDESAEIVFSKGYDYENNKTIELQEELDKLLQVGGNKLLWHNNYDSKTAGLIYFMSRPMIIASTPIYNNDRSSTIIGTLIMGRFIDSSIVKNSSKYTDPTVSISSVMTVDYTSYKHFVYKKHLGNEIKTKYQVYTRIVNNNVAEGITILKDILGNETIVLNMQVYRIFYAESIRNLNWFICTYLLAAVAINISALLAIQKLFVDRIERLNEFINQIKNTNNTSLRIKLNGHDEITNFASGINLMLDTIEEANRVVKESEERLRLVMEGANDGFWDIQLAPYGVYFSNRLLEMVEYDSKSIMSSENILQRILQQEGFEGVKKGFDNMVKDVADYYKNEHRIVTIKGNIRWLFIRGKVVEKDQDGKPLRLAGIVTDITEIKQSQEEVEYLSFNDSLTGLYNRAYFINKLEKLDHSGILPLSVIMGDVNGLKMANDAFGHNEGDRLLVEIADILRKACRKSDIIARLGGDEFVILLPDTAELEAAAVYERIKLLCDESELRPIKPNISLGIATKQAASEDIHKVYEIAEERMYKNKLLESRSARHSIIALMEKTLYEMDYETEAHTERVSKLATEVGKSLSLSNNDLDELRLLAKLHDIGKTAIPREILMKVEPLTEKEWEIMKQHAEIGYRMAMATPDLAPIAESILSHHEKWNGSGYPRGLKGDEIPILARIIAIADAYDVITHARPYKKAFTHETAMAELKRCSEAHFDPDLIETFIKLFNEGV